MDRNDLIERLERYFRRWPEGLAAVYVYGSRARGTARAGSDVDLGLLFDKTPPSVLGGPPDRIADDLGQELRLPVRAVVLNTAPADLVHRVLRDGILAHEADPSARVRFEVARRREYLDSSRCSRSTAADRAVETPSPDGGIAGCFVAPTGGSRGARSGVEEPGRGLRGLCAHDRNGPFMTQGPPFMTQISLS